MLTQIKAWGQHGVHAHSPYTHRNESKSCSLHITRCRVITRSPPRSGSIRVRQARGRNLDGEVFIAPRQASHVTTCKLSDGGTGE